MRISSLAAVALAALAACDPSGVRSAGPDRALVSVAGETVAIVAPPGFCLDEASTSNGSTGAFVLMADCALLGEAGPLPGAGAVLTASIAAGPVIPEGDGGMEALAEFLGTAEGRAMLGRSGDGARTRLVTARAVDDVLYVLVEDGGAQPIPGVEPEIWRAFIDVRGRMAALTVQGFADAGLSRQAKLELIQAFAGRMRAANPVAA